MKPNEGRKRLKAVESRRALLDAGLELLKSRGVAPGLDRVTLKEAIELSGVPRSTAYRLYEGGRGQLEEFRADLLADMDALPEASETLAVLNEVLTEHAAALESQDAIALASVLRELIRRSVEANVRLTIDSLEWRIYMSSLAASGEGTEPALIEMFRDASREQGSKYSEFMRAGLSTFGLRFIEPITIDHFGAMMASIVEGVALRMLANPEIASIKRPTGPNGALVSWNASAIAIESLVLTMTEPDPNVKVSADLSSWTRFC